MARHYVGLLRPAKDYPADLIQAPSYEYWANLYQRSVNLDASSPEFAEGADAKGEEDTEGVDAKGEEGLIYPTIYSVSGQYYCTLYKLFRADVFMQKAYELGKINQTVHLGASLDAQEEVKKEVTDSVEEFVDSMVTLRRLTRSVLGSHWFLWTEFALYSGIDLFLNYLEPKILQGERADVDLKKMDEKFTELTGKKIGYDTKSVMETFKSLQSELISTFN